MTHLPDVFYPIASSAHDVTLAVQSGARFVQIRLKSDDHSFLRNEIKAALHVCRQHHAILVVNDHWKIALEEGASHVHLGQEDLITADCRMLRQSGVKLGISTHDRKELEVAQRLDPYYIALGPIWETTLKVMPWRPQGIAKIREWVDVITPTPLVAIGGITAERSAQCLEAGAASVSVVSDIFRHRDTVDARVRHWRACIKGGVL